VKTVSFKSVEQADGKALEDYSDVVDQENTPPASPLSEEENVSFDALIKRMRDILGDKITDIRVSDRLAGSPAVLTSPDGVSSSMEKLIRVMQKSDDIPKKILEVNPDHPLIRTLLRIYVANAENPLIPDLVSSLFDNVQMLDGYLDDPYRMADRNLKFMDKAASWYADLLKI